jgi:LPXTG-site transpeptidase (sortase) family protein
MKLPLLGSGDRLALKILIVAVPIAAFAIAAGATIAMSSNDKKIVAAEPTVAVNVKAVPPAAPAAAAAPVETAAPSPTAVPPNRQDCAAIRGTAYLSSDERSWFLQNCPAPTPVPGRQVSQVQAPPRTTQATTAVTYGSNDRLAMPRLGINAPVNISVVPPDGTMGVPLGANDVVLYDFSAIPGLGGYPGHGGNTVIAGHVDYICCLAVFAPLRNVEKGDVIDYYTGEGDHFQYVVQWFGDYGPDTNWASLVGGGPNVMTLITCNGTFDVVAHEYSHRRVVRAVLVQ